MREFDRTTKLSCNVLVPTGVCEVTRPCYAFMHNTLLILYMDLVHQLSSIFITLYLSILATSQINEWVICPSTTSCVLLIWSPHPHIHSSLVHTIIIMGISEIPTLVISSTHFPYLWYGPLACIVYSEQTYYYERTCIIL